MFQATTRVNGGIMWGLRGAHAHDINVRSAYLHMLGDAISACAVVIAGVVVTMTQETIADPIVSLLIAALMTRSGVSLVRASGRIFLEAAPEGLDPQSIGKALVAAPGVVEVHDLHVWEISSGFPALSAHVLVGADSDCHAARRAMEAMLHERFALDHTTLQVDHARGELLEIEPARGSRGGD